jgi:hypothetical protein
LKLLSYSVGGFIKSDLVSSPVSSISGLGNNHETSEIFISFTPDVFAQVSAFFQTWANVIKSLIIGHAASSQFHL